MSGENKEVGSIDRRAWKVDGDGTTRMDMDLWLQLKSAEIDGDNAYQIHLLQRASLNSQGKAKPNNGKQNIEQRPVKTKFLDPPAGSEPEVPKINSTPKPLSRDTHSPLYQSREKYRPIDAKDLEPKRKQVSGNNLPVASRPSVKNPAPKPEKGKIWLMGTYVDTLD